MTRLSSDRRDARRSPLATAGAPASRLPTAQDVVSRLSRFSRWEDPASGRAEEQAFIDGPRGRIFTTSVVPLNRRSDVGFVICHSFAYEQFELFPMELTFARMAASAGYASVCFQAHGYNDAGGRFEDVTPATQLEDALAVAGHARDRLGIGAVVPVGPRLGAAIALAAAQALGAPGAALWNPSLDPDRYLEELIRAMVRGSAADVSSPSLEGGRPTTDQLRGRLESGESVELLGYPVTGRCFSDAVAMDPLGDLSTVPARILVVVVNPRNRKEAQAAATRLGSAGAEVRIEEAQGLGRSEFGLGLPIGGHLATHLGLFEDVATRTVTWAGETW